MDKLNRKERRLLEHGSLAERTAVHEKLKALAPPKRVIEKDGLVLLPVIHAGMSGDPMWQFMIPRDQLDPKYFEETMYTYKTGSPASGVSAYRQFILDWFFGGLKSVEFTFKPNVHIVGTSLKLPLKQVLLTYLHFLMDTRESEHNHKKAYMAYVIDMCCTDVTWERAKERV